MENDYKALCVKLIGLSSMLIADIDLLSNNIKLRVRSGQMRMSLETFKTEFLETEREVKDGQQINLF